MLMKFANLPKTSKYMNHNTVLSGTSLIDPNLPFSVYRRPVGLWHLDEFRHSQHSVTSANIARDDSAARRYAFAQVSP